MKYVITICKLSSGRYSITGFVGSRCILNTICDDYEIEQEDVYLRYGNNTLLLNNVDELKRKDFIDIHK